MNTNILVFVLGLLNKLGPKANEAWPHIQALYKEIVALLTIANGGHPVSTDGPSTEPRASELVQALTKIGASEDQARKMTRIFEIAGERSV